MPKEQDLKLQLDAMLPGVVLSFACAVQNQVSKIYFSEQATSEQKAAAQAIVDAFDWNKPEPNIKGFFDGLVKGILAGAFPADVFVKAQMIERLVSPAEQAYALNTLSADQSYTVEQKAAMNQLIAANGLALPEIPAQ